MKFENGVLVIGQFPAADEAEIRHVFLVLHTPNRFALTARIGFQGNSANVLLFHSAGAESRVAGAKDCAEDAVTRGRHPGAAGP